MINYADGREESPDIDASAATACNESVVNTSEQEEGEEEIAPEKMKLRNLISANISEKLEQLQVRLVCVTLCFLLT